MADIEFRAPDGAIIDGMLQHADTYDAWTVTWPDPDNPALIEDYADDGPDCPVWESVDWFGQSAWRDVNGKVWLSHHLISGRELTEIEKRAACFIPEIVFDPLDAPVLKVMQNEVLWLERAAAVKRLAALFKAEDGSFRQWMDVADEYVGNAAEIARAWEGHYPRPHPYGPSGAPAMVVPFKKAATAAACDLVDVTEQFQRAVATLAATAPVRSIRVDIQQQLRVLDGALMEPEMAKAMIRETLAKVDRLAEIVERAEARP